MAKRLDSSVHDAALNVIKNGCTTVIFCSADPVNYAGIAAVTLITKGSLTSSNFTGPAADAGAGRKLTVNAITGMTPSSNGTVAYVVGTNGSDTLYFGTTVTSQAVTTSQTWNSPAFDVDLGSTVS